MRLSRAVSVAGRVYGAYARQVSRVCDAKQGMVESMSGRWRGAASESYAFQYGSACFAKTMCGQHLIVFHVQFMYSMHLCIYTSMHFSKVLHACVHPCTHAPLHFPCTYASASMHLRIDVSFMHRCVDTIIVASKHLCVQTDYQEAAIKFYAFEFGARLAYA